MSPPPSRAPTVSQPLLTCCLSIDTALQATLAGQKHKMLETGSGHSILTQAHAPALKPQHWQRNHAQPVISTPSRALTNTGY